MAIDVGLGLVWYTVGIGGLFYAIWGLLMLILAPSAFFFGAILGGGLVAGIGLSVAFGHFGAAKQGEQAVGSVSGGE